MRRPIALACAVTAAAIAAATAAAPARIAQAATDLLEPTRIVDTRTGLGSQERPLTAGEVRRVILPDDLVSAGSAVALNLTADRAAAPGWVSAWSCADPQPATSILNVFPGEVATNGLAATYTGEGLCVTASTTVDLIVDLTAVLDSADYQGIAPQRLVDTRQHQRVVPGQEFPVQIAGSPGIAGQIDAAALNVTVIAGDAAGWLALAPCGAPTGASTVNFGPGEVVPHFTFTGLTSGTACVTTSTPVHVVVDSFGWLPDGGSLDPAAPARLLDTRSGLGGLLGAVGNGRTVRLRVAGVSGVSNSASGAIVNIVGVASPGWGYVTAWPCGAAVPHTSILNLRPGGTRSNQATLALSEAGEICLRPTLIAGSAVHLVVDAVGAVAGEIDRPAPPTPDPPQAPAGHFATLPVGASLPSGAECAARVRPAAEVRPDNATANHTRGTRPNTSGAWDGFQRVDGDFVGTTDEIIQWAACKWGIDEDVVRAQIVKESNWHQAAVGDNGESFGLGQVRTTAHQSAFVDDNAIRSSAYNLDYTYAVWRACFEGQWTWLNDVERGAEYTAGDQWGCLGVWFSGRWYTAAAVAYIEGGDTLGYGNIGVKEHLANRTWEQPSFIADRL